MGIRKIIITFIVYTLFITTTSAINVTENTINVIYDGLNGLATSEANDIEQTDDGIIWIGSYGGLMQYDGQEFKLITQPKGLTGVLDLFKDSKNRLWIGTNNDGIVLFENNEYTFFDMPENINSYSVRSITEDSEGNIVVGTGCGMFRIETDGNISEFTDPRIANEYITQITSFDNGKIIGITKTGSIFIIKDTEVLEFIDIDEWHFDIALTVFPMKIEGETHILVGTVSDYIVDIQINNAGNIYKKIDTQGLRYINALELIDTEHIWIGADNGIGYMDEMQKVEILDKLEMNNSIENIMKDSEGNFWFVSSRQGVMKVTDSVFKNLSNKDESDYQVTAVEILGDYTYITYDGGVKIQNSDTLEYITNDFTQKYDGVYIRCVRKDQDGNLWFSTYSNHGVVKYNPETNEIREFSENEGIEYSRIRSTEIMENGEVWVASGNGVYVIKDDKVIAHYNKEDGIENLEILTISTDNRGKVYVGTDGAGFYIIENGEIIRNVSRNEGLQSNSILRMKSDPKNAGMWIVTGNSIEFYSEDGELKNIEKFPYMNNFDILFYDEYMIILSSNGIYFTTSESMLSDETELEYIHKNHADGLYSTPVVNSFSTINENKLYICGHKNLTSILLEGRERERVTPPININNITLDDKVIYLNDNNDIKLSKDENYIMFDLSIPTFSLRDLTVKFGLVGFDEKLRETTIDDMYNPIYSNLPGGNYTFSVELLDAKTGEILNNKEINIEKEYYFFEDPGNRMLITFLSIIIISICFYLIIRLKEKNTENERRRMNNLFEEIIISFSKVIDAKDGYTNGHSQRVATYTREIAIALNFDEFDVMTAYGVALLHDVGKIGIPDEVLNKNSKLTDEEYNLMKSHADIGAEILQNIKSMPDIEIGAKYHHERYDGNGYGHRLKGEDIPLIARMICVADAFDAMYSSRVYRKNIGLSSAIQELKDNRGTQFDPMIVDKFVELIENGILDEYLKINSELENK